MHLLVNFPCSQSGDDPDEDLTKFDYKLKMKVENFKHPSIFLAIFLKLLLNLWLFKFSKRI
jgi:hypothetical protein